MMTFVPAAMADGPILVGNAADLENAVTSAVSNRTIQLTADITGLVNSLSINENTTITIDMNGHNINSNNKYAFQIIKSGANLILVNTSAVQSRLLVGAGQPDEYSYRGIRISGSNVKATVGSNVTIETGLPVMVYGNGSPGSAQLDVYGTLKVSACLLDGHAYAAISGNGTAGKGGTVINIYQGALVENPFDPAIYIPQDGVVNVYGGTIKGKASAIAIKSGNLNISGGTLRATGPNSAPTEGFSNGVNASGAAIQIESNTDYTGNINVNITGGAIISANGYALYEYLGKGTDTAVTAIIINGGMFLFGKDVEQGMLLSQQLASDPSKLNISGVSFVRGDATEVKAGVDPTFMIVIPTVADFGALTKTADTSAKEQDFYVEAKDVVIEQGAKIEVKVGSDFKLSDGSTPTPNELAYKLFNVTNTSATELANGDVYHEFSTDETVNGKLTVDQIQIVKAGSYSDTMVFTITYVEAA
jgi:hypothetical protein